MMALKAPRRRKKDQLQPTTKPRYHDPRLYYVRDPQHPSIHEVAKAYKLHHNTIKERCRLEKWVDERDRYWDEVDSKTEIKDQETIADMNVRHLREARLLQGLGLQALKDKSARVKDAGMAGKLVDTGVKIERTIRGEPTERQDVKVTFRVEEVGEKAKKKGGAAK